MKNKTYKIFYDILSIIGYNESYKLILASLEDDLYNLNRDIDEEEDFLANYKFKSKEDLKNVKSMKIERQKCIKLVRIFKQFIKENNKK